MGWGEVVRLPESAASHVAARAVARHQKASAHGARDLLVPNIDVTRARRQGAIAELAVARYLGLPDPTYDFATRKEGDLVGGIEVRSTIREGTGLRVYIRDVGERPVVLAWPRSETEWVIPGWAFVWEARELGKFLPNAGRAHWLMSPGLLRRPGDLKRAIDLLQPPDECLRRTRPAGVPQWSGARCFASRIREGAAALLPT